MEQTSCQKNLETCAYWKATLPFCEFGSIYKPGYNGGEKIVYTFPTKKIPSVPLSRDRNANITTTTTTTTNSFKTGKVTRDQSILPTEYPAPSRRRTSSPVDVVSVSLGVGLFSFALGMIIVLLMFRGNKARKEASRKRRDQIQSVFLIGNGTPHSCCEDENDEHTDVDRYHEIRSIESNVQVAHGGCDRSTGDAYSSMDLIPLLCFRDTCNHVAQNPGRGLR
ncbi:uncharacterized protein LOC133187839 isoform X1 [Saccostrea echinata]|uniref:uncharacterized protein LOC133187839 isoform X1 n=1 Tax=Saccostrea echinata TaxID=191078 RepID=UPI002A7F4C9D|nr:uncharacterized protein LOC133187839 isoform X1 [Saccostrea echinata]